MEQKRVLWIVAAVGLFLLVVIGAALLISNPVQNTTHLTALEGNGSLWINTDGRTATVYTSESPLIDTDSTTEEKDENNTLKSVTVLSENTFVYNTNAEKSSPAPEEQTIQVVAPKTETVAKEQTVTPVTPAVSTKPAAEKSTAATSASSTTSTKTSDSSAKPSASTVAASSVSAKTSTVKTVTRKAEDSFFVQVGSFTSKKNAEDARALLSAEKIPAEIFTWKNDKGTVFFRLRVGPYKTKTEANYWLSRIKSIDGFAAEAAYVVNSPATEE